MKYYALKPDRNQTVRFSASCVYDASFNEYDHTHFKVSNSLKGQLEEPMTVILDEPTSFYKKNEKLTDFLNLSFPGRIPCVSKRCMNLFKSLKLPLEYFKVQIKGKKIELLDGYFIAKLVGKRLHCVDLDKSEFSYNPILKPVGKLVPEVIKKLIFDGTKIPEETKSFVLGFGDYFAYFLWASENVVQKIQENNLIGFEFIESGDFKKD